VINLVCASPVVISGFGVEIWYGSAASVLVVGAIHGVDGGSIGTGVAKVAAAISME
jgi:hypothetical protein